MQEVIDIEKLYITGCACSLEVSVRRLRLGAIIPRHQLVQLVDFVVSDAFQNPSEPRLWIDFIQFGCLDQGKGDGHGITAAL